MADLKLVNYRQRVGWRILIYCRLKQRQEQRQSPENLKKSRGYFKG